MIERGEINNNNNYEWLCQCKCGTLLYVSGANLTTGSTKSCGCYNKERIMSFQPLVNKKFGKLTVIKDYRDDSDKRVTMVKCDCGKIKRVRYQNLIEEDGVKSCGCGHAQYGENNPNWNGGISEINNFFRNSIGDWKKNILDKFNNTCIITNKKDNIVIHHLEPFNKMVSKTFDVLDIDFRNCLKDYTKEELNVLQNTFIKLHNQECNGVLITDELHKKFHKDYGYKNFSKENFDEFFFKLTKRDLIEYV